MSGRLEIAAVLRCGTCGEGYEMRLGCDVPDEFPINIGFQVKQAPTGWLVTPTEIRCPAHRAASAIAAPRLVLPPGLLKGT